MLIRFTWIFFIWKNLCIFFGGLIYSSPICNLLALTGVCDAACAQHRQSDGCLFWYICGHSWNRTFHCLPVCPTDTFPLLNIAKSTYVVWVSAFFAKLQNSLKCLNQLTNSGVTGSEITPRLRVNMTSKRRNVANIRIRPIDWYKAELDLPVLKATEATSQAFRSLSTRFCGCLINV